MTTIFITFALLGAGFAIFIHKLKSDVTRKASTYRMYAARDELVCLVAESKLEEENPIFEYYYSRANYLLKKAPSVGIDVAIDSLLKMDGDDIERALEQARKSANEMYLLVEKESEEVSEAVSMYYEASRDMMLAHSSKIRLLYIFFFKNVCQELHCNNELFVLLKVSAKVCLHLELV